MYIHVVVSAWNKASIKLMNIGCVNHNHSTQQSYYKPSWPPIECSATSQIG